ncbi:MAG: hypothetical protein IKA04_06645 [Alistipes sp.]|nr:hypothetical protein [Alistipes sp.]
MARNDRKLLSSLRDAIGAKRGMEVVEYMWQRGLCNRPAVERLYFATEVERRVRAGETKCRAIEQLSKEMSCSYEKVRTAVYTTNRANNKKK